MVRSNEPHHWECHPECHSGGVLYLISFFYPNPRILILIRLSLDTLSLPASMPFTLSLTTCGKELQCRGGNASPQGTFDAR